MHLSPRGDGDNQRSIVDKTHLEMHLSPRGDTNKNTSTAGTFQLWRCFAFGSFGLAVQTGSISVTGMARTPAGTTGFMGASSIR